MKFCPKCGANLNHEDAAFCTECGEQFSVPDEPNSTTAKHKGGSKKARKKTKKPSKRKQKKREAPIPEVMGEAVEDDYDGYYNDVLPPDMDREKEGLDPKLIQNIAFICIGFLFIVGLCVALLYML